MIFPDASKPARMGKNKTSNKKGLETMKQMRKILVLLLAVVMVMSLATTAFAANTTAHTITVNNQIEGYTYEAYRIFEGTLKDSGELQDLNWSDGVNSTALMTALKEIDAFKDCETPADVANVLNGTAKDNATAQAFADAVAANLADKAGSANTVTKDKGYEINVTGDGYYFVKTTTVPEATDTTAEGTYTRYILKVVGNVTVTHKGNVPTVTKVIVEGDDEKKASDAAVGDTVTFKLTATLPSDYDYYKAYQLIFNDTLSTGLTYNGDAKVYLDSVADTYLEDGVYQYDVTAAIKSELEKEPETTVPPTTKPSDSSLPQTGQLNWPIPILVVLGLGLFIAGWLLRFARKKDGN